MKPRIDLSWKTDPIKDAKAIYANLGVKDSETNIKTLQYKGHNITLKNLDPLVDDIREFEHYLKDQTILTYEQIVEIEAIDQWKDIIKIYFDNCYNPQALAVTGISRQLLEQEGLSYEQSFDQVKQFLLRHRVGNSKPIIAGHNIGSLPRRIVRKKEKGPDGFDNPFMEIYFDNNGDDFFDSVDELILDTIKMARIKWSELANYTLGTVANELGLTLVEAHRALPDTVANAKVLIKMLSHLRGQGSEGSSYVRRKYDFQF